MEIQSVGKFFDELRHIIAVKCQYYEYDNPENRMNNLLPDMAFKQKVKPLHKE